MRKKSNQNLLPKDRFFNRMRTQEISLTYEDVRIQTGYSDVVPSEVEMASKFSRNVSLMMPIVSAAMDRVTEYKMAIELARLGGIGVIHRGLSPKDQASHVARVKYFLNGFIEKPRCVQETDTIENILRMREEKDFGFHSFPVINLDGKLVGILSGDDFDFCDNYSKLAKDVMTKSVITVTEGTDVNTVYSIMKEQKKKLIPVLNSISEPIGLYVHSDLKRIKTGTSKIFNTDELGQLRVGAAIGTGQDAIERADLLIEKNVDVLVMDTAHADSKRVYETLKELKRLFSIDIVVGNVSEADSARRLLNAGADGIKIGQGPGAICTTRIVAGIGRPQVTAVYECEKAIRGSGVPICADGGIKYSGDIVIAIAAGADSVMLGNLLAGTKESPGEVIYADGRSWKEYRGMGSLGAMIESAAARDRYGQKDSGKSSLVPEGIEGRVPYRGTLKEVVDQYVGGLRSGMGYVGARNVKELQEKADFIRNSSGGISEAHPSIVITREAPNYTKKG